jgi:CelD/BcsL family acetyltransferase involved in cellulose biosynthesis
VAGISQQDPDLLNRPVTSRHLSTKDYIETARITVADSFDSYWAARGKNLRQNMKRQRSRLIRDHVTSRLVVLTRPDDIAAAVDNFGLLESRGWKAGTGTAVHPDNAQGRFYRKIMVGFAARGEACVAQYFFGERLVACDLCVNRNGVFIVLKTTYDESEKDTSPAMLMRQELFQQLFAASTWRRIEFYGRVMEWHRRWSDEVRVMYHTTYYRWPWLAALMRRRSTPAGLRADVQPAT